MKRRALVVRGLTHYWRTNIAVVLGVATAVAVLAGALLVGDSVRGSLRDLVVQRLGRADRVVFSTDFFREALAADLTSDQTFSAAFADAAPVIVSQGLVTDQDTGRRTSRVQVYGVDDRFWRFHGVTARGPNGREALLSRALAADIGAREGGSVIVRLERPSAIPIESLHGRKDDAGRSVRLTVRAIVPAEEMGDFSVTPGQGEVRAVFVPLRRLQHDLDVAGRVNALLVADRRDASGSSAAGSSSSGSRAPSPSAAPATAPSNSVLTDAIKRRFGLEDVGLTLRIVANDNAVAVESSAGLLDAARARAVSAASSDAAQTVFTYLANTIRSGDREVPYSLVTATDLRAVAPAVPLAADGSVPPIVLNEWTARELDARSGAPVTLEYYVWEDPGRLVTRSADFRVAGIFAIGGAAADRDLAPVYPGITEAKRLGDWDPPFPIDLSRIRRADEDYWDRYRTTPKAFIPIEVGQKLWSSRFGDRTSVRITPQPGVAIGEARDRIASAIRSQIDPLAAGLAVRDVRADGLAASRGATDFGEYFAYFSFFLVVSALMLAALFFRLGVEQRAREVGLLRSVGYTHARVRALFSAEGFVLAALGSALGVAGAVGYGAAMMAGLRTWWSGAVGTTALRLHISPTSLAAGAIGALVVATICIWWTLRGLSRLSERGLLAGQIAPSAAVQSSRRAIGLAVAFALVGATLSTLGFTGGIDRTGAFFGAGMSLLVACLFGVSHVLRRPPRSALGGHGWRPLWRVGLRNAADRPGRSVLAIGVIASAAFIIIAVDAFRRTGPAPTDRHSGTGGYSLLVDLLLPIVSDPNGGDGREALGLSNLEAVGSPDGNGISIDAFRVLPGDDASCLNLYEPRNPRILGAPAPFVEAGRFAFQSSLASNDAERANPWRLLQRDLGTDVVPVVADATSLTYVLHKSLGDEIVVANGGRPLRLRIVAALADSVFQRELVMSDANFARLFPEQEGYRLLLVDAPAARADATAKAIEDGAADLGADAVSTSARLAEFHTVENTYLSTFQTLGGLGLLVGTFGLGAVVLRNVLERRRELALLGAVGYRRGHLFTIVLAENLLLLAWGLGIGVVCALVAIAPAALEHGGRPPTPASAAALLVAVLAAGLVSSVVGTGAALRTPLLGALRSE